MRCLQAMNLCLCREQNKSPALYHRNQQYSITAITDGSGAVSERYAYSAYGTTTILDASLSPLAASAVGNRYMYTGREWDETLALYHYRARMYDSVGGRFVSRDPIGFWDGPSLYYGYFALNGVDPTGLAEETYNIYDMNYNDPKGIETIIAEVDVWAKISSSDCRQDCDNKCVGNVSIDVGFRWRGLADDSQNTRGGGQICGDERPIGEECEDLKDNDDKDGKNGSLKVSVPCTGGTVKGEMAILATTQSWEKMQEVIENMVDRGMTREEAMKAVRNTGGFLNIEYEVTIAECGKVKTETVGLRVQNPNMWQDRNSPRIWPKDSPFGPLF
jgi:RHS repeat-associated protein